MQYMIHSTAKACMHMCKCLDIFPVDITKFSTFCDSFFFLQLRVIFCMYLEITDCRLAAYVRPVACRSACYLTKQVGGGTDSSNKLVFSGGN